MQWAVKMPCQVEGCRQLLTELRKAAISSRVPDVAEAALPVF